MTPASTSANSAGLPELIVADAREWRGWLRENHQTSAGIWLVLAKKGTTDPTTLTYDPALAEALCQGWIDGQVGRRDAQTYVTRFTPRRARSRWSARNVGIVSALISEGRIQPAGLRQVEQAKADGRWEAAYSGQASQATPADLDAALSAEPRARAMFEILTSQNRFAVIYRLESARRPETRVRRIEQFVAMLARGETPYPQKRTPDT
ncbi:MAG: YdeI/OmpD-associated family protein [Actinomycetota bacterium]